MIFRHLLSGILILETFLLLEQNLDIFKYGIYKKKGSLIHPLSIEEELVCSLGDHLALFPVGKIRIQFYMIIESAKE